MGRGFLAPFTGSSGESHRGTIDAHDLGRALFIAVLAFLATTDVGLGPYGAAASGFAALLLQMLVALETGAPLYETVRLPDGTEAIVVPGVARPVPVDPPVAVLPHPALKVADEGGP